MNDEPVAPVAVQDDDFLKARFPKAPADFEDIVLECLNGDRRCSGEGKFLLVVSIRDRRSHNRSGSLGGSDCDLVGDKDVDFGRQMGTVLLGGTRGDYEDAVGFNLTSDLR
jgi:hypothetical protein